MKDMTLRRADFLPLAESGTNQLSYGGKQAWFTKQSWRVRGCGPVAAANILCYLAGCGGKYRGLYPDETLTQDRFLALMDATYRELSPAFIGGLFSRKRFVRGIIRWAEKRGVPLTAHLSGPRSHSQEECFAMIRRGLERDRPVAAVNLKLRHRIDSGENFGWHWVTVTGLRTGPEGKTQLELSSWGRCFRLDWDSYWNAARRALFPGGFVWFE